MLRRISLVLILIIFAPSASMSWTHIAREGETLTQLAIRYYGRTNMVMVLRAANGFVHPDDGSLIDGERVEIPEVTYYRIRGGDTWDNIADKFLASPKRGRFLAQMNGYDDGKMPPQETLIKVPYHLRHIFAPDESLKSVNRLYYGKKGSTQWLKQYNLTRKTRFKRGDVVIIPLMDLDFTKEEQERTDSERAGLFTDADAERQEQALRGIARIKETYEQGNYIEAVAIGQRLMGQGDLTLPQKIGVYNYLGFAYVALDKKALARDSFTEALKLQPGMELSPITTSPKILEVFLEAKKAVFAIFDKQSSPAASANEGDGDKEKK
jgi:phage tail protein X